MTCAAGLSYLRLFQLIVLNVLQRWESMREAAQKRCFGLRWLAATANVSRPVGCVKIRILDVVFTMRIRRRLGRIVTEV